MQRVSAATQSKASISKSFCSSNLGWRNLDVWVVELIVGVRLLVVLVVWTCGFRLPTCPLPLLVGNVADWQWASLTLLAQRAPFLHRILAVALQVHAVCIDPTLGVAVDNAREPIEMGAFCGLERRLRFFSCD